MDTHSKPAQQSQIFLNPNSPLPKTYFQLIQKVGSSGKYQRNMFFINMMVLFVTGTVLLSPSFLFMNDQYGCEKMGLLVTDCKKTVCEIDDPQLRKIYFTKNKDDIKSAASDYGPFMCEDEYLLDMIKSGPYFGSLLGYFLSSFIAGNVGRKKLMTISLGIASVGSVLAVIGFNLPMVVIGVIFSGMGVNVACGMSFCYLAETVEDNKRQKYSILVQVSFTIGTMLVTGFYATIADWRIISIILQAVPVVITFILYVFYAQQTPMFLLKSSNDVALKALNRIGLINTGRQDLITQEDIENVRTQQLSQEGFNTMRITPWDLLRYRSLRATTICCCLFGFVVLSMYYGPSLIIDEIGFDTFVSSFAIQLSELISYLPCWYFIDKLNRQTTGFWCFLTTVACSFIILMIDKPEDCGYCVEGMVELVVIFVFRFALGCVYIMFMLYAVELFPTRVVGVASTVSGCACTLASTLCSIILGALDRLEFELMLFFFFLGVIGCALSFLLKETHNKPIEAEIQEIAYAMNKKKTEYFSAIHSQSRIKSQQVQ